MAKTEKVLEGVSSVEIVSADGTTFIFDVEDLIIEADDGALTGRATMKTGWNGTEDEHIRPSSSPQTPPLTQLRVL